MGIFDKVKQMVSGGADAAPATVISSAAPADEFLEISFATPAPDAPTCQIRFDRPVAPEGTALFETPQDAADWPAIRALLGIPGVHSVISKGEILIVGKRETTSWPALLAQVEGAIRRAFGDDDASGEPPVARAAAAAATGSEEDLRMRIQDVLETEVNPAVESHGGYIELLEVQGTRVFLHMGGGCQGCAMSTATLKQGVESTLRARIPEITEILDTTDHAAGTNPYYHA